MLSATSSSSSAVVATVSLIRRSSSWMRVRYSGSSVNATATSSSGGVINANATVCGSMISGRSFQTTAFYGGSNNSNSDIHDSLNFVSTQNIKLFHNTAFPSFSPQRHSSSLSKKAARALQQINKQKNKKHNSPNDGMTNTPPEKEKKDTVVASEGIKQILETGTLPNDSSSFETEKDFSTTTNVVEDEKKEEEEITLVETTNPRHFTHPAGHLHEFAPRIVVVGVGGAGGNAVNNMIARNLQGVDFLALNTDAQHLSTTLTDNRLQIGTSLTSGLGCGANPDAGRLAAQESSDQIHELLKDAHMVFITAGMGGGTGTGAAPVIAEICYNLGILTVGVVTKPFFFEGTHRMQLANEGISRLRDVVDTLIVIPNQNLFKLASDKTSFMESFAMADDVLLAGVRSITDLMTTPGLINLDFADVQSVMHGMGNAMLGTGQACHDDISDSNEQENEVRDRAILAADQALSNPLLGESMDIGTAKGMLVNISGGNDMTLYEVDRAAQRITERVKDVNANIIFGGTFDGNLDGCIRVSVVATGIEERTGDV